MKKLLTFFLLILASAIFFTSCQKNEDRLIIKQETLDGQLWITYKDDPDNPVCVGTFSTDKAATEGLEYCLQDDGTYWVAAGSATNITDVIVPSTYQGKPVTGIMRLGFHQCSLKTISLPNTIRVIDEIAFYECYNLISVEIPHGVEVIGERAFSHCGLAYASIPETILSTHEFVFYDCGNLIEVCNKSIFDFQNYDGESRTFLGTKHIITDEKDSLLSYENDYIFYRDGEKVILCGYTGNNTELVLPKSEKYSINSKVFYGNKNITKVVIPSNVTHISKYTFVHCKNLVAIEIDVGVESIHYAFAPEESVVYYYGTEEQWQQVYTGYNTSYSPNVVFNSKAHY